ncbi:hypothetical protein RF11_01649 [Thelohanellus kitauei]|uniref:Uncharacterized protein n=1 Tax=Thelohanellus kitauei TaxID=669202 RepID=A0A0C2IXU4_THEKT|nr:hypothetical protein RF11_01649 [Thelohanellus kitauei]
MDINEEDLETIVSEVFTKVQNKPRKPREAPDALSLFQKELHSLQPEEPVTEYTKCTDKHGFVCCVTGIGGPFYSSAYIEEFARGLSMLFRCMRDIFEPKHECPTIIRTNKRGIILTELYGLLFIFVAQPSPTFIFHQNFDQEKISFFCQAFNAIFFEDNLKMVSNRYNSLQFSKAFGFLLNGLYDSSNQDISFLFGALPIHPMAFNGRKIIEIFSYKTLPKNVYLAIFLYKKQLVSIFISNKISRIDYSDIVMIYSIVEKMPDSLATGSCYIPLVLQSIDPVAAFHLFVNNRRVDDGFDMGLLHAPKEGIPNGKLSNFVDDFYEIISSDLMIKSAVRLCLTTPYPKGKPKLEFVTNFIVVYHDKRLPQYHSSMSDDEFQRYKQIYMEMFLRSKYSVSSFTFTHEFSTLYFKSKNENFSFYCLANPFLSEYQIDKLCEELINSLPLIFRPIIANSYLLL